MNTLPTGGPGCNSTGRPVRRPRVRRPVQAPPPPADMTAPAAKLARYEILVGCKANRIGHEVIAATRALLALLEQFEHATQTSEVTAKMFVAGLIPEIPPIGDEFGYDHFKDAAENARGFTWGLREFAKLFRSGLVRDPNQPGRG